MADQRQRRSRTTRSRSAATVTVPDAPEAPAPTLSPPDAVEGGTQAGVGLSEPTAVSAEQISEGGGTTTITEERPSLAPPGIEAAVVAEAAVVGATWRSGVLVSALWSINEIRNAWMHVVGVGWKKIYNGRDGAFTALVTLASQARQTGRQIAFREEADGMVYEIYLW